MFIEFPFGKQRIFLNSEHIISILRDEKYESAQITFINGEFQDFQLSKDEFNKLLKKLNQ